MRGILKDFFASLRLPKLYYLNLVYRKKARVGKNTNIQRGARIYAKQISIGNRCYIGKNVKIVAETVKIEDNVIIEQDVTVTGLKVFTLGEFTRVKPHVRFYGEDVFQAGENCRIGENSIVNVHRMVRLGNNSCIGINCEVYTHGFFLEKAEGYEPSEAGVDIGNNVWLTTKVVVLPGTRIRDNTIIRNLSVVSGDVPGCALYGGNPLKKLLPEAFFRKKHGAEEKLRIINEAFLSAFQRQGGRIDRLESGAYVLERNATKHIYIACERFDRTRYIRLRTDYPDSEILYLAFTRQNLEEIDFGSEDPKFTLFDLNTKNYRKAGTEIEVFFKLALRDRYALFTSAPAP